MVDAVGLMAGRFAAAEALGREITTPPVTTAMGALLNHITTGAEAETFQPMNVNFGLFPAIELERATVVAKSGRRVKLGKREKNEQLAERALASLRPFLERVVAGGQGAA